MHELQSADYTTLWRRIRAIAFEIEQLEAEGVTLAIDAMAMKITNKGEWMRGKEISAVKRSIASKAQLL